MIIIITVITHPDVVPICDNQIWQKDNQICTCVQYGRQ